MASDAWPSGTCAAVAVAQGTTAAATATTASMLMRADIIVGSPFVQEINVCCARQQSMPV
ncbi:MAG: hypothetical protein GEV28_17750 [Actinophytocola sp.]|uniref:hypothetical protein n=1 Tax=Actinophytocola sp. TaxID=1872138 RepID=UPI0013294CC2|nr:hypothetical protein [Actinophytocola sp.]MPZ82133.1 hypothetical protein [Actinophytocola sp.]